MTALENIQSAIAPELLKLNEKISSSLSSDNALMDKVIKGYLKTKGKMIRPIMVILSAKLFGDVNERVIAAAAAVEMLHNASLIHDDVVDESKLRRNLPTVNALWDNHIAVLVGDFFVSSALQQAISTDDIRIISSIANLGRMLSLGEIDQIYNARYHNLDENAYLNVISRKTASLFVACVEMGAFAVGQTSGTIQPLRKYAELLGRCFQIKDDIFDYFDNSDVGKPTGNDLREGKITLPLLHVLTDETVSGRDEMLKISAKEELASDDIARLIAFARENGGIDYAYSVMERMRNEGAAILEENYGKSEATDALNSIFDFIISRNY